MKLPGSLLPAMPGPASRSVRRASPIRPAPASHAWRRVLSRYGAAVGILALVAAATVAGTDGIAAGSAVESAVGNAPGSAYGDAYGNASGAATGSTLAGPSVGPDPGDGGPRAVRQLTVQFTDNLGQPLDVRAHIRDSTGQNCPPTIDTTLIGHNGGSFQYGYCYPPGTATVPVAEGLVSIHAGRGFEWLPVSRVVNVQRDTTIAFVLQRAFDMRAEGWFSGDVHVHAHHEPLDVELLPSHVARMARGEDLAMMWLLDDAWNFTGGPHPLSTSEHILYFSVEYRNQAYGHAPILGLDAITFGIGCCTPPSAASPMLSQVREGWNPQYGEAMVLAHPSSTTDFFYDGGWPGWGLGRELPVLATSGNLDAMDIASYSNVGTVATENWESLLNCGFMIPPSAGTDAVVNRFYCQPPGGYRVYVQEDGGPHTHDRWVEGLKAGRTFVTNYPLIPIFTVDGASPGDRLELAGPSATVQIQIRVQSAVRPSQVRLLRNGEVARTWMVPPGPSPTQFDVSDSLTLAESSWLAVEVDGTTTLRHAASPNLFALTNAVVVELDSIPLRSTVDAARMMDWIDDLATFVDARDNWPDEQVRAAVMSRLSASRAAYGDFFEEAPGPFALLTPAEAETLVSGAAAVFDWTDAADPEAGDEIRYYLSFASDTLHPGLPVHGPFPQSQAVFQTLPLRPDAGYYWQVAAVDRGDNRTVSTPAWRGFYYRLGTSGAPEIATAADGAPSLRVAPNPATGPVRIGLEWSSATPRALSPREAAGRFAIYDLSGRLRALLSPDQQGRAVWNGRDAGGNEVPSGLYWVRWTGADGPQSTDRVLLLR